MANFYKEIVTKAVLGKGKKTFVDTYQVTPSKDATTILGCWVINHKYKGIKDGDKVTITGSYDVNIWYSCENDTTTEVIKENRTYQETVNIKASKDSTGDEDIIIRSLKNPSCLGADIKDGKIEYKIEKELGIEIVGDTKVKIQYDSEEDPWDVLDEDEISKAEKEIDKEVVEDFIEDKK